MGRIPRRYCVLCVIAVPVLGMYTGCVHRFHSHVENAGWSVDFSYIALACRFCRGRVEQFTFRGRPVPLPHSPEEANSSFTLIAPVGRFESRAGWTEYRSHFVMKASFPEAGEPVSPNELEQGYYDVPTSTWPPVRRPGTLAHWCFASSGAAMRWLDPERIHSLGWAGPTTARSTHPGNSVPASAPMTER